MATAAHPKRDTIERAPTGRAACRVCKQKIDEGALRFGKIDLAFSDQGSFRWYHLACAWTKRKKLVQKLIDEHGSELAIGPEELRRALESETAPTPKKPGDALPQAAHASLVAAFRDEDDAAIAAHRRSLGDDAVATFVWEHVEAWERGGGRLQDKWALRAFGREIARDDALALRAPPLVERLIRARRHDAVESFLDLLVAAGTPAALLAIHRVSERYGYKGADNVAREALERVAEERGLAYDELEDRLLPAEADATRGNEAEIAAAIRAQTARLERALASRRTWSVADFETYVQKQPLVTELARRLVWSAIDAAGSRVATFVVDETRGLLGADYENVALPADARVRLLHPAELDEAELVAWSELLADFEILSPFPQLDRPLHTLDAKDQRRKSIRVLPATSVLPGPLHGVLNRAGWEKGREERGVIRFFYKRFVGLGLTAVLKIAPGLDPAGKVRSHQRVEELFFIEKRRLGWGEVERIPPTEVSAIAISEAVRDVHELAAESTEPKKPT